MIRIAMKLKLLLIFILNFLFAIEAIELTSHNLTTEVTEYEVETITESEDNDSIPPVALQIFQFIAHEYSSITPKSEVLSIDDFNQSKLEFINSSLNRIYRAHAPPIS
tara:strand:- start:9746 stop:10069 length:324 start_codon:yes stop_codon:yes gene_type:complete